MSSVGGSGRPTQAWTFRLSVRELTRHTDRVNRYQPENAPRPRAGDGFEARMLALRG